MLRLSGLIGLFVATQFVIIPGILTPSPVPPYTTEQAVQTLRQIIYIVPKSVSAGLAMKLNPESSSPLESVLPFSGDKESVPNIWVASEQPEASQERGGGEGGGLDITKLHVVPLENPEEKLKDFVEKVEDSKQTEVVMFDEDAELIPQKIQSETNKTKETEKEEEEIRVMEENTVEEDKTENVEEKVQRITNETHSLLQNIRGGLDAVEAGLNQLKRLVRPVDEEPSQILNENDETVIEEEDGPKENNATLIV